MRFSSALPFLASALVAPSTHAARSLPRDELNYIISSAATNDSSSVFGRYSAGPATTTASFAAEMEAQWETIKKQPNVSAPYMVCDSTPGVSGYARSLNIASVCSLPNIGDRVIHNLPERTCFDAQLLSADALTCAGTDDHHISVVPYTPWLKMSFESLYSSLRNSFDESTLPDKSTVETARYSASFAEKLTKREREKKRAAAEEQLQKVWDDTPECVRDGTQDTFDTIFSFQVSKSSLKLHQSDSAALVHPRCLLHLIQSLAKNPFVSVVEFDPVVTTFNHEGRWIIQGSVMDENTDTMVLPFHDAGIMGLGQVAQMSDTGLSVNSCYFYDSTGEVPRDKSKKVENERRKVIQYYAGKTSEDENGHGTHCAGTILGNICTGGGDGCKTLPENSAPRDGTAPEAKIAVYDIGNDSDSIFPDDADPMFVTGRLAGATVHSASWGGRANSYQARDRDHDKFQYENPDFLVVFAAGNSGSGNAKNTVSSVAKNNLNVCATMNKGAGNNELYAAYFSSMGPSSDGRIKPDICAPGHVISSAQKGSSRQCSSSSKSGTSMACPGVAGAALLIRQYFIEGYYPSGRKVPGDALTPSGALIKATILNSGRLMLGRQSSDFQSEFYDESQGFGLISLVDAVYIKGKSKGKVLVWDNVELTNGQVWKETIALDSCSASHTSITLNYFDKENDNTSCTTCIVNRLDLTVKKDGQILYPNGKAGPDTKNNAQRIRIPEGNMNSITVKVKATNLVTQNQKFALVISGCVDIGTGSPTTSPTTSKPTISNFPSLTPSSTPSKVASNVPSLSPSVTCVDDPEFVKGRGGRQRTCKYIGEGNKVYRLNKWCNKYKMGELISKSCCKTCKKCTTCGCVAGEIPMKRLYVGKGNSKTIQLNGPLNNVRQLVGKSEGMQFTPSSTDFILLNREGKELGKLNIHASIYGAVVKQSVVFDPAISGVTAVKLNSLWNAAYLSELEAICDDDEEYDNVAYARIVKGCVRGGNIILHENKSVKECRVICDSIPACVGFEYGVDYGGNLGTYKPRDCQPQNSRETTDCPGDDYNLDFYQYPYLHVVQGCVRGIGSKLYSDKSVKECEAICDNLSTCRGFDYGVSHGGEIKIYKPRDCLPQISQDTNNCNGKVYNLDFYRRDN